jgi:hypothetical protein
MIFALPALPWSSAADVCLAASEAKDAAKTPPETLTINPEEIMKPWTAGSEQEAGAGEEDQAQPSQGSDLHHPGQPE